MELPFHSNIDTEDRILNNTDQSFLKDQDEIIGNKGNNIFLLSTLKHKIDLDKKLKAQKLTLAKIRRGEESPNIDRKLDPDQFPRNLDNFHQKLINEGKITKKITKAKKFFIKKI